MDGSFEVRDADTGETVYTGSIVEAADMDGRLLFAGDFTGLSKEGKYYIRQTQIGDSYDFEISDSVYEKKFVVLERIAREYTYTNVSDAAYILTNMLFLQEMFGEDGVDSLYVKDMLTKLMY